MPSEVTPEIQAKLEADDQLGKQLQQIQKKVHSIGRKSTEALFLLGDCMLQARELLGTKFSAWVKTDLNISPRTARNYERIATELEYHRALLVKRRVMPTVVLQLACNPAINQQAVIEQIQEGRVLRVKDLAEFHQPLMLPQKPRKPARSQASRAVAKTFDELEEEIKAFKKSSWKPADRTEEIVAQGRMLADRIDGLAVFLGPGLNADRWREIAAHLRARVGLAPQQDVPSEYGRLDNVLERALKYTGVPDIAEPKSLSWSVFSGFKRRPGLRVLELCAGAGGLANGLRNAGFDTACLVERSPEACETLRLNFPTVPVVNGSIGEVDLQEYKGIDLISGGLPCPPFSALGDRLGRYDSRNLFPIAIDIIRDLQPRALLFENVAGIMQPRHTPLRTEIIAELESLGYSCLWDELRADDFAVPQRRRRTFLVGFRTKDMFERFSWPTTAYPYCLDRVTLLDVLRPILEREGWTIPDVLQEKLRCLAPTLTGGSELKKTLNLGRKSVREAWKRIGIDGSGIAHTPPGPNHDSPEFRLTLEMMAAIQGFPRDWKFAGSRIHRFRQIANAVPGTLAAYVGAAVRLALTAEECSPHQLLRPNLWWNQKQQFEEEHNRAYQEWLYGPPEGDRHVA